MGVYTVNQTDGSLVRVAGGTLYADAPIGAIQSYGGETAPAGWLICDGSTVSRTEYAELFAVIGINFGEGDGETTFGIPDLRECVPVGVGKNITKSIEDHDRYNLGQFKDDQLQGHNHGLNLVSGNAGDTRGVRWDENLSANYEYTIVKSNTGRSGTTTHGKQLGVNYIIKAKESGMPTDVTEGVRDVVSTMESYSTAETDTGKNWIDGKRIYRKVYTELNIATTTSGWRVTDIDASDIDCIVHSQMIGIDSSTPYSENEIECSGMVAINKNTKKLDIITVGYIVTVKKIVVEYTKTT